MSDVGHDLRDAECFGRWVDTLPADLANVLRQASMTYFEFDDAISVAVPHALEPVLRKGDVYGSLMLRVASHYDENRGAWIASTGGMVKGQPPSSVVMPRVLIEVLPLRRSAH
jgi:hypothetical protein